MIERFTENITIYHNLYNANNATLSLSSYDHYLAIKKYNRKAALAYSEPYHLWKSVYEISKLVNS